MRAFVLALPLLVVACGARPPTKAAPARPAPREVLQDAVPSFTSDAPALLDDIAWQRAAAGDAIDLARLAEREGATGLLAALDRGGAPGRTALLALPHAPDAELAAGRLCELSARVEPPSRPLVLSSLHGVLSRPVPGERLDAAGLARCRVELSHLRKQSDLSPADRDRTEAAQSLLAEQLGGVLPH